MAIAGRLDRLRTAFEQHKIDGLLVTNLVNIRYLTGFSGSAALLLVTPEKAVFTTDGRYGIQAEQQLGGAGVAAEIVVGGLTQQKDAITGGAKALPSTSGNARLGLESHDVTWGQQLSFADTWFGSSELVAVVDAIEQLRQVKDAGEIARIAEACRVADQAFAAVLPMLRDEPTEAVFALELDYTMRRLGADDISFDTIVASGPNGAKAHHEPGERIIRPGELIVCDFGALVDGYHSDMTRTVCVDEPADSTLQEMYDIVFESQAAGVAAVKVGATAAEVDTVCRAVIEPSGWGDTFTHSTGHGVGLDIHESPVVAGSVTSALEANQVVTVEPGVYLKDIGGVRIEDTLVVDPDGCTILTNAPKDLVIA